MGSLLKTILSLVAITATSRESARTTYSAVPSGAMANPSGSSMEALKLTAIPRTQQIPHALGVTGALANQGLAALLCPDCARAVGNSRGPAHVA